MAEFNFMAGTFRLPAGVPFPPPILARDYLAAYEAALVPATQDQRTALFRAMVDVVNLKKLPTQADRKSRWKIYHHTLGDLPPDLLLDAMRHCLREKPFFPTPSEFRAPVKDRLERRMLTASRLRLFATGREIKDPPPPTPEERARVLAEAEELKKRLRRHA